MITARFEAKEIKRASLNAYDMWYIEATSLIYSELMMIMV